jgi:hypothetical protein
MDREKYIEDLYRHHTPQRTKTSASIEVSRKIDGKPLPTAKSSQAFNSANISTIPPKRIPY